MNKTYDALVIPTGETSFGDKSFPVTNEAIKLFYEKRFGCIFITGGYNGFATAERRAGISEAEETRIHILNKGIPEDRVYCDDRSLDSVGNFTFPIVNPIKNNPRLDEFNTMLIIGKEGHLWRLEDYADLVIPQKNKFETKAVPGKHNNGLMAKIYHNGLMNVIGKMKDAEEIHDFLMKKHPFYSKGWYEKSVLKRKLEMGATGFSWFLK